MARHASRRDALEEAIRLRDEAGRLYAKLDGLVQTLIAEEAAAQRQAQIPLELLRPASPQHNGSMAEPLMRHRYSIVDEPTGKRRLTSVHLTSRDAAERYPGAQAESTKREERPPGPYSRGKAPMKPGNGGSSDG